MYKQLISSILITCSPLSIYAQGILCVQLPAGVDNESEEACGCSAACASSGICSPEGTGSCTQPGTSPTLVFDTETMNINIPANRDAEITVTSLNCPGDLSTPGSYLEGGDNFVVETNQGNYDHKQDGLGGSFPSSFGNYVNESFCYSTTGASESISIKLTGNRKDECLSVSVNTNNNEGIPGSSGFGSSCHLLAVDILTFTAEQENESGIRLTWETEQYDGQTNFVIERSYNGIVFTNIGTVRGSLYQNRYQFLDNSPNPGLNYYRLKQLDGTLQFFSAIKVVRLHPYRKISIQNPVKDKMVLRGSNNGNLLNPIVLFDLLGRQHPLGEAQSNQNSMAFDVSHLPPGYYFLYLKVDQEVNCFRILKL